jgi:hypothetical protein
MLERPPLHEKVLPAHKQRIKEKWIRFNSASGLNPCTIDPPGYAKGEVLGRKSRVFHKARVFLVDENGRTLKAGSHLKSKNDFIAWYDYRKSRTSRHTNIGKDYPGAGDNVFNQFQPINSRVTLRTGHTACLAYHNDEVWNIFHFLAWPNEGIYPEIYCRDKKGSRTSYCTHTYAVRFTPKNIQALSAFASEEAAKDTIKYRNIVNLYIRIPWLLLNPDPFAKDFARMKKPASLAKVGFDRHRVIYPDGEMYEPFLSFTMPGSTIYHPALFWFVNALGREIAYIMQNKREYLDWLLRLFDPEYVSEVINSHDYNEALEIWYKLRPHIVRQACMGNSVHQAWFIPSPWNNCATSSIHWFEHMVMEGGWISLGPSVNVNWLLRHEAKKVTPGQVIRDGDHACYAKAWEHFITNRYCITHQLEKGGTPDIRDHKTQIHENFQRHLEAVKWW